MRYVLSKNGNSMSEIRRGPRWRQLAVGTRVTPISGRKRGTVIGSMPPPDSQDTPRRREDCPGVATDF